MDGAERHPGAVAEVSCVSGRLHRHWNRGRALDAGRDLPADAAGDPVRGIAVIPCGRTPAPLRSTRKAVISTYGEKE
jgi:hypothetical protein